MRSMSQLFLLLLILAPLATAEWVRFEAEDAVLSSTHATIVDNADASGGKVVSLDNAVPYGTIDFTVNIREPNVLGTDMRVGFRANYVGDQKYDNYYLNSTTTKYIDQNWACDYYWDPATKPDNFEAYRNSIALYGTQVKFQLLSRWWAAWDSGKRNIPMTLPLIAGKNTIRIESAWSQTSYDFIELSLSEMPFDPDPADGDTEVRSTQATLSWDNQPGTTKNVIYFGQSDTEPNFVNYQTKLTTVITLNNPGDSPSIAMPTQPLADGKNYYWLVDGYVGSQTEPNFPGAIWSFKTQFNAAPVVAIETPYPYLVGGTADVPLDATVTDDGAIVSWLWEQVSGPASAVINSPATEDTTITVTEESGDTTPYVFRLTVSDGTRTGSGTVTFYVDDTACEAARRKPGTWNTSDVSFDCKVNMADFALLASNWLSCLDTVTGNNCN